VHLVVDALGLPLAFEITEGQRHDSQPAKELLQKAESRCLLADKAYDSDDLRKALTARGCSPVIPSKANRAQKVPHDTELYKARSDIECAFSLLKQARRFATRYEKPGYVQTFMIEDHAVLSDRPSLSCPKSCTGRGTGTRTTDPDREYRDRP